MRKIKNFLKIGFHSSNIILISLYLFPGSIFGCFLYNDCYKQPQITRDLIVSTNHVYAFFSISLLGLLTFKKSKKINILILYLLILSIVLELSHLIIPGRSFQLGDLFGNLVGVIILIIINYFNKKNENY